MSFDTEPEHLVPQAWLDQAGDEIKTLRAALECIARFDENPLWHDSRDDAANAMLSIARAALGLEEP
jgi:hypothetical protein